MPHEIWPVWTRVYEYQFLYLRAQRILWVFLFCFSVDGVWFHVVSGLFFVHVYNPSITFGCCFVQDYNWAAVL